MSGLLYLVALILMIGWALGVFVYHATGLVHCLLAMAVLAIVLEVIARRVK